MSRLQGWVSGCIAVAGREWRSTLVTPLGWCVLAAFAVLSGAVFGLTTFQSGAPATLRGVFIAMGWAVLATAPALSMRSIAEERRHGTWASLLAAPAGCSAAVVGKYLASVGFLALAILVPTVAQLAALEMFARPDYGEVLTAVLGLLLAGSAYIASGVLMSALTGNQVGAYLLTLFLWLVWIVLAKAAPAVLPARAAYVAFAIDPLQRLDDFLLGVLDSGNVAFFACTAAWFLWAAVIAVSRQVLPARLSSVARTSVALLAGAVLTASVVGITNSPSTRAMLDMTKTRAYTLADSTRALLDESKGDWTIAVIMQDTGVDPAVLRQIDEVLQRMADQQPQRVRTVRVDPTDPADAARYEQLLEVVQQRDAPALAAHATAIAAGLASFDRLASLASVQQTQLADVVRTMPADSPDRTELDTLRAAFAQLTSQKSAFDRSIREIRTASDARPFPDEARAAAAIASNLRYWGEQLQSAARALSQRQRDRIDQAAFAAWIDGAVPTYMSAARDMRVAQDALEQLPSLDGASVGAALASGDAAMVIGPPGIAVIPGSQLVAGGSGRGAVTFDRRFRGEQLVAAAIRSMQSGATPVAVFVHSGAPGLLRARPDHQDLAAAADALRAARIDVAEWVPGEGPEPTAPNGRPLVWIIMPPTDREGSGDNPRDRQLLAATEKLIARGDPVLMSVGPSLLPLLGQRDPWAEALASRGLTAQTGRMVLELVPVGPNRAHVVSEQVLREFSGVHAVGNAVDGQLTRFDTAVPLQAAGMASEATTFAVAAIEPSAERWIESDWRREQRPRLRAPEEKTFDEPIPVVMTSQSKSARGATRAMLVGSPAWLSSSVADMADTLGGGRVALRYPGNRELLVNAVAWLAGRDDLVASSGSGREVDRLPSISRSLRLTVAIAEAVGVPALLAALGATIVLRRRWRT